MEGNFDGDCTNSVITIVAYSINCVVIIYQLLLLTIPCLRKKLQNSFILYFLLIGVTFGFIWSDLTVEVLHLKHFINKFTHLHPIELFYAILATYWIGLEFYILFVEILIRGWIESHHEHETKDPNSESLNQGGVGEDEAVELSAS